MTKKSTSARKKSPYTDLGVPSADHMPGNKMILTEWTEQSLCWNVHRNGWVSDQDYQDDVEASAAWPATIRDQYYRMSPEMVKEAYRSRWGRYLFFGTAFLYIHSANGAQAVTQRRWKETWKCLAVPGFLLGVVPAFLVGLVLTRKAGVDE